MANTNSVNSLDEVTLEADRMPEDQEPLIRGSRDVSTLFKIHILIIIILLLFLVGGLVVGIWLIVVEGVLDTGGGAPDAPFLFVNRTVWGAREPKNKTVFRDMPVIHAVIIHTDGISCSNQDECSSIVRNIQNEHLRRGFDDIAYNFLVGGDGQIYEGRGWDLQGAFAKGFNNVSLGIAFIGTFETEIPPKRQLQEAQTLIAVSVERKKLLSDYVVVGHCQLSNTASPGKALFDIIKTWPHWKDCYKESCFTKNYINIQYSENNQGKYS